MSAGPFDFVTKLPSASEMVVIEGEGPQWKTPPRARVATDVYLPDINGDRHADLVALTPSFDVKLSTLVPNAGAINAVYSRSTGLSTIRNQQFFFSDLGENPTPGTGFGFSGAIGNLVGNDQFMDFIGSAPGAEIGNGKRSPQLAFYC